MAGCNFISLYPVDHTGKNLDHIADGTHDTAIDELGAFIQRADHPILLYIGYEFDGEWNHYDPEKYIAVFQHVVDRLQANGVTKPDLMLLFSDALLLSGDGGRFWSDWKVGLALEQGTISIVAPQGLEVGAPLLGAWLKAASSGSHSHLARDFYP